MIGLSTRGPIARGTIRTTFVLGLRLAVQAGTLLIVARMLGPREFGAFAGVAALAVVLGTLSTFGTHLVLLGEVSKDPGRRNRILEYALPTTLACGGLLLILYYLICIFALARPSISITVVTMIGIAEILLQPLLGLPASEHLALGRVARSQLLRLLPLALRLAAAATILSLSFADPLSAYGYGYALASVAALCIAIATMPAPWPRARAWRWPTKPQLRESVGYGMLNITAAAPAELDKTLATRVLSLQAAGFYAASARVIGAASLPVIGMMQSALPRLFREGWDRPERTARLLRSIFGVTLVYGLALAAGLWFIAPAFVWLFGGNYAGIQRMIRLLCLAVPWLVLRIAAGSVLMALGKPWMRVGFELTGLVVLVVAAIIFPPLVGSPGMPLALLCSELTMAAIGILLIKNARRRGIPT